MAKTATSVSITMADAEAGGASVNAIKAVMSFLLSLCITDLIFKTTSLKCCVLPANMQALR